MAFSEDNRIDLAKILGVAPVNIENQISWMGTRLSTNLIAKILDQVQIWDDEDLDVDFDNLHPRETNFGFDSAPERLRRAIRQRIAELMERPDWAIKGHLVKRA